MFRLALVAAIALTSGCSTLMNDRLTAVDVSSATPGTAYTVTNKAGAVVHTGTTPERITLDAARGWFKGETYQVAYKGGPTVELDSRVCRWYWAGAVVSVASPLVVDPLTGDMFTLPSSVSDIKVK